MYLGREVASTSLQDHLPDGFITGPYVVKCARTGQNTLEIFGSLSGLKVNTDKTKIIWPGKKKHSQDMYDTIKNLGYN